MLLLFLLLAVRTALWVRGGVVGDISGSGGSSLCISPDCSSQAIAHEQVCCFIISKLLRTGTCRNMICQFIFNGSS